MLGFPLWWALGLRTVVPMAMAVVMADQLLRKRRLVLPGGLHAVVAVPRLGRCSGSSCCSPTRRAPRPAAGRPATWSSATGVAWYLTATVCLLWVTNLRESELPDAMALPAPRLHVRGHHGRWAARRTAAAPGVDLPGRDAAAARPAQQRPGRVDRAPGGGRHPERPRAAGGATQGAVPVRQLLGQQPLAVPARSSWSPGSARARAGSGTPPRSCCWSPRSRSSTPSTAASGSPSRSASSVVVLLQVRKGRAAADRA